MNLNRGSTIRLSTLVLLAIFSNASIAEDQIYHWVDENGVSNYSQYPPGDDIPGVSKQELEHTAPPGNGQTEDVYNVKAHEKRMAAWREERDQKRKNASERKRVAAQQQPTRYPEQVRNYSRSLWYPPFYGKPPHRPPVKPQPPIENPRPPSRVFPRGVSH